MGNAPQEKKIKQMSFGNNENVSYGVKIKKYIFLRRKVMSQVMEEFQ